MLRRMLLLSTALVLSAPSAHAAGLRAGVFPFPTNFLWGAATAAHQVEGHLNNDWVAWEKGTGHIHGGDTSEIGTDMYRRYDEDFALAEDMGHNVHRLSVEWARIEPEKGKIDQAAVKHYHDVLASLSRHHMKAMVTLFHFTNPTWVAKQGGWLNHQTEQDFAGFAAFMAKEYGTEVAYWCTLNEPNVYAFQSYDAGTWPPQHHNRGEALHVMANLFRAHAMAYRALHQANSHALVGVANHIAPFDPLNPYSPLDTAKAYFNDDVFNLAPMRAASLGQRRFWVPGADGVDETDKKDASCVDFVGVNYYTRWMCTSGEKDRVPMPGAPTTAMGWEDYPYGLYRALQMANAYTSLPDGRHIPIIITENGIDDPTGDARASYLVRHLQEVQHALQDGIEVRGYIHWTLVDNFEWADGYRPRFGLYKVDRSPNGKLKREATPAVNVFRDIARANALEPEVVSQYGMKVVP